METEYLAVIITISVIGGVVFVAFLAVCITKIVADKSLKKSLQNAQPYGKPVSTPTHSYVRYNDPEPQTPTALPPGDLWESDYPGYHTNPAMEDFTPDPFVEPSTLQVPLSDLYSRRPSVQYRPPSVALSRHSSYAQDLPPRNSYAQDMPRRPSYAQRMQLRPPVGQGMPRTRHSYAPDLGRRPPQPVQRSSSMFSQVRSQPPAENKLWFHYIKDDPDYFSQESLEWNRRQPRVWQGRERGVPPPSPHHALRRTMSEGPNEDLHRQAAARLSWI